MKKEKAEQRKVHILQAAARLISRYGFDKTTMDDIAHAAGVSKGALYLVWPSKDDLLDALINFELQQLLLDFQSRLQADPQGGNVAVLYRHMLLALKENALVCALYTRDQRILGDFVQRQSGQRYAQRLLLSDEAVRQMQSAGLLRADIRAEVLTYLFSLIAVGFMHVGELLPAENQPPLEETAAALTAVIESGFAGPNPDSAAGAQALRPLTDLVAQQYAHGAGEE